MKKTVTANVAGTVFHIEEDAYDQLQRYLASIRANFSGSTGAKEIMTDIESRVAELFTERLVGRNVVVLADVEHVMSVMGQPEDFADGTTGSNATSAADEPAQGKRYKRLYRDPDDKWVSGLLGGLGAYIGLDPIWLRVAMIVLVWASVGGLIPIYILLWILVPKAESAADRLRMRGEPVTVENIKRTVEEGADRVMSEAKDLGREWSKPKGNSRAGEIIGKIIGVFIIVFAFSLLLSLITALIGGTVSMWHATWSSEDLGLLDLGEVLFNSKQHALWFGIGLFVLAAVPIIGLFLAGFRLLLNTRSPKWLGWTLALLWWVALFATIACGLDVVKDMKRENTVRTEIELVQPPSGILYLDALSPADSTGGWSVRFDDGAMDVDLDGLHLENGRVFGAWADLDVERSADTLFHLKVMREAKGRTTKVALNRAEGVTYDYRQEGDVLYVSPVMSYSVADKFRAQDVHFTLEVPMGKQVFLRPGSEAVIFDIDNVTNTYDSDMLGRTWTMTERGLMDLDAPLLEKDDKDREDPLPLPTDTVKVKVMQPIAATVWKGPSKPKTPHRAQAAAVVLPDLFTLLRPRL